MKKQSRTVHRRRQSAHPTPLCSPASGQCNVLTSAASTILCQQRRRWFSRCCPPVQILLGMGNLPLKVFRLATG